jgi:glycosyltransferase involved in cell wall biosynthesis
MTKVAMFPNPSAARYWRLEDPAIYLRQKGFEVEIVDTGINDAVADWADIYVLQGIVDKQGIATLYAYQQERGKKIVVEQDDRIEIEATNPHKQHHNITDAAEVIKTTMGIADMVTTTTKYLARKLKDYNPNVRVLPNYLNMRRWDLPKQTSHNDRLRVGWAGSITHLPDLVSILPVLRKIQSELDVEYVFVGEPRLKNYIKGLKAECMLGVPFEAWPSKLHGLRLDIGLAPLRNTEFNRCKSNIKFLEYAIAKIPGVYSKTVYSRKNFDSRKRGVISFNEDQWYLALRNLIICKSLRDDVATSAYAHVRQQYNLESNIYKWVDAYNSLTVPKS